MNAAELSLTAGQELARAAAVVRAGGVVVHPTEGVWGLACDPRQPAALRRVLRLKGRAPGKGLLLIAADVALIEAWLRPLSPTVRARILASWPGPVTWIVPAPAALPREVTGGRGTVAVRVTGHRQAALLARRAGGLLVSTSSNPAGLPPHRHLAAARRCFGRRVDHYLPGRLGGLGVPTTLIDARSGVVLRPGATTA